MTTILVRSKLAFGVRCYFVDCLYCGWLKSSSGQFVWLSKSVPCKLKKEHKCLIP